MTETITTTCEAFIWLGRGHALHCDADAEPGSRYCAEHAGGSI